MPLARHVHAVHAELADAMLGTLWDLFNGWGLAESAAQSPQPDMVQSGMNPKLSGSHSIRESAVIFGAGVLLHGALYHVTACLMPVVWD